MQLHSSNFRPAVRHGSCRPAEHGVIITLVAVVMLFVIGAMAALSIDVVTLYTARSEAQLAADAGALAGARALANSGMTSDTTLGSIPQAEIWAQAIATQVAANNRVGGRNLNSGSAAACTSGFPAGQEICVSFNDTATTFGTDPQVTVRVQRTDLPTFFARIWGSTQLKVTASATAEAYNPSGVTAAGKLPVATTCVKPWVLPNIDPSNPLLPPIFDPISGAFTTTTLQGWQSGAGFRLRTNCTSCTAASTPNRYRYYPGDPADFPPPAASTVACNGCSGFNNFQLSIVGCVQSPISCNSVVHIDQTTDANRDAEAAAAVDQLAHASHGGGADSTITTVPPFQFLTGTANPVISGGKEVMVSDSLVTVPVVDTAALPTGFPAVRIVGFLQIFLLELGNPVIGNNHIDTQVINLVGCGSNANGQPILGNGASPVAVRLISQ